jgi:cold shock CspA family protein
MAKSGQTFNKKEKEKNRAKQRQEKAEKMEERKANAKKGKSLDEMMAYIDEDGNISSTPPDPSKRRTINAEDIEIGVPKYVPEEEEAVRTGVVSLFGFIKDLKTGESVFVHVNGLTERIVENNKVSFEVEQGPKGLNAYNVKKAQ